MFRHKPPTILASALWAMAFGIGCERPPAPLTSPTAELAKNETTATSPVARSSTVAAEAPLTTASANAVSREVALQARADELRRRLGPAFHIRHDWPFVAAGNLARTQFDAVFEHSLVGSYKCLRRDYFAAEPDRIIAVYLFKDDSDYRRYADELFGDRPDTPYGYYSNTHRALIMNIGTGTGTLVHELCHALIERDFPRYPTWFNEGLASLHEQCAWREGSLVGLPNWRLPALQEAIREGKGLPLKDLMAKTTAASFYNQDKGLNYATARYLCQYIQQQGKLKDFCAQLKRDIAGDRTGEKTLVAVLASPLDQIEAGWRRWVLTLRFPE